MQERKTLRLYCTDVFLSELMRSRECTKGNSFTVTFLEKKFDSFCTGVLKWTCIPSAPCPQAARTGVKSNVVILIT